MKKTAAPYTLKSGYSGYSNFFRHEPCLEKVVTFLVTSGYTGYVLVTFRLRFGDRLIHS